MTESYEHIWWLVLHAKKLVAKYCGCTNHVCRRLSFGAKVDQAFDSDSVKLVMEIPRTNEREALNHQEPNQSAKPVNGISTRKWHSSASGSPYFDNFLITTEFTKRETRKCSRSLFWPWRFHPCVWPILILWLLSPNLSFSRESHKSITSLELYPAISISG